MAIGSVKATVAFTDPQNNVVANGTLTLDLSQPCTVTATGGQVDTKRISISLTAGGLISPSVNLWQNDQLTPTGTTYRAQLLDSTGAQVADFGNWSIVGTSPVDLSQMVATSVGASYPAPGLLNANQTWTGTNTFPSPIINGTPSGTGIPTITLKKGTGAGNYTTASTTYVQVDGTNLTYTVTIPTGWKLAIACGGSGWTTTASVFFGVALADGGTIIFEIDPISSSTGTGISWVLNWVINGDGASHTIDLRFKTSNASDAATIQNNIATSIPTMVFNLTPSN